MITYDANCSINNLISKINYLIKLSTKKISNHKYRFKNHNDKEWITPAVKKSCSTKNKLYRAWQENPFNLDLKNNYKKYANKLNNLIKYLKFKYEKDKINNFNRDNKKIWNFVKDKIGTGNRKNTNIDLINHNNFDIKDPFEIANHFNTFFAEIGPTLTNKLAQPTCTYLHKNPKVNNHSIFFSPINESEICKIISTLKSKSGGIDGINTKIIKLISPYIVKPLTTIFNNVLQTGIFPEHFKKAEIIPIYKSGDRKQTTNYRPIALISNFAKILEKLIHKRLFNFLNKHNILSKFQFGFRPNMGTNDSIAYVSNLLFKKLDKSIPTIGIFLDLAKAFDVVDFKILLNKLERCGIRGLALKLFESYLKNRSHKVKINNVLSTTKEPSTGVPQGTVLGPLLFLLYLNDIFDLLPENSLLSYADDTIILCSAPTWKIATELANKYLNKIYYWLYINNFTLNIQKTVYMTFGNHEDCLPENITLNINGIQINRVTYCKYLGIIIDHRLKWKEHINFILRKIKYLIFIFSKLNKILSKKLLLTVYHGLFNSIATYGIIAWGSAYDGILKPLVNLQKRILKLISPTQDNNLLNIFQSYMLSSIIYHYNFLSNNFLNYKSATRYKPLILPKNKLEIGKKNHLFIATRVFNKLPYSLKILCKSKSKQIIVNLLKKFIHLNILTTDFK